MVAVSGKKETLSLASQENAVQMNEDLMKAFREALEKDPAADLLSMVGRQYLLAHRRVLSEKLSEAGKLNLRTVSNLFDDSSKYPEADLQALFPSDYARRYKWAKPKVEPTLKEPEKPQDWLCKKLDKAETATVVYPLSDEASSLLPKNSGLNTENSFAESLKALILRSERLWEMSIRGAVLKASDKIVIKLISSSGDLAEYHNLEYLASHASDLPIPSAHGVIMLGPFYAMFISYIPGITLEKAWPSLSHEAKLSVQKQLNGMLCRLRKLRQDDGMQLGSVDGEGAKDSRVMEAVSIKGITTAIGFNKFQFSATHRASPCYVDLLRSFLEEPNKSLRGSVFTHGDLKKTNIIVRNDTENTSLYTVTGIIDWEDSGFYPEYHECTMLSNGQSILHDDDWYLYAPECISPLRYPIQWLVDRLWVNLLWNWRSDIVR